MFENKFKFSHDIQLLFDGNLTLQTCKNLNFLNLFEPDKLTKTSTFKTTKILWEPHVFYVPQKFKWFSRNVLLYCFLSHHQHYLEWKLCKFFKKLICEKKIFRRNIFFLPFFLKIYHLFNPRKPKTSFF